MPRQKSQQAKSKTTSPSRDRRPYWLRQPGLFPSPEAVALGRKVLPYVRYLIEVRPQFASVSLEHEELELRLVDIAAYYLETQKWMELQPADFYPKEAETIQVLVETTLKILRATPPEKLWELALLTRRRMGMELWEKTVPLYSTSVEQLPPQLSAVCQASTEAPDEPGDDSRPDLACREKTGPSPITSVEQLLAQLLAVCQASTEAPNKPGDDGRPDLACAASHLASLWETLSEQRFGKYVSRNKKIESTTYAEEFAFDSPGAEFVRDLLPAFDPSVTLPQITTAIKSVPVKPKEDQHSLEDEEGNAGLAPHRD